MKTFTTAGILILLFPVLLLAQGSTYKLGTTIRVNQGDTIATNVMAAAQFVDIFGHLDDDLFSASRNLVINGSVSDDAIVAAQTITVRGMVGDMLMAAGETIVIDGEIAGDLFVAGNEIRLTSRAKISGNVALGGNDIMIEGGTIGGWLRASGNRISLDGTVDNYVELYGNTFTFGENYRPSSSTTITTTHELEKAELGKAPDDLNIVVEREETWGGILLFSIWFYISMLIVGFLLILIFKQTTVDLYRYSTERYFKNTGVGFLLFIVIPIAIILLLILVLTIPLSAILAMLYGIALAISFLLVSLILGTAGIRYFKTQETYADYFWGIALGIILILLLTALPYVGGFVNLVLIFFGLGTLLSYFWQMKTNAI